MVVRAYATGTTSTSIWTHYERGVRVFCGHRLPDGLKKNQKLPAPILTPTTKAPKGEHDVCGSREEILATGKVTAKDFDEAAEHGDGALRRGPADVRRARPHPRRHEVRVRARRATGAARRHRRDPHPRLVALLAGERPTTSASRAGQDPEPLDKDFVRRCYIAQGYTGDGAAAADARRRAHRRGASATSRPTSRSPGETFVPDTEPPARRASRKNLELRSDAR